MFTKLFLNIIKNPIYILHLLFLSCICCFYVNPCIKDYKRQKNKCILICVSRSALRKSYSNKASRVSLALARSCMWQDLTRNDNLRLWQRNKPVWSQMCLNPLNVSCIQRFWCETIKIIVLYDIFKEFKN